MACRNTPPLTVAGPRRFFTELPWAPFVYVGRKNSRTTRRAARSGEEYRRPASVSSFLAFFVFLSSLAAPYFFVPLRVLRVSNSREPGGPLRRYPQLRDSIPELLPGRFLTRRARKIGVDRRADSVQACLPGGLYQLAGCDARAIRLDPAGDRGCSLCDPDSISAMKDSVDC